jgi:hypothetical protein
MVIVAEKLSAQFSTWERAINAALIAGKVSCEKFMKFCRVHVGETVRGFLYRARFGKSLGNREMRVYAAL